MLPWRNFSWLPAVVAVSTKRKSPPALPVPKGSWVFFFFFLGNVSSQFDLVVRWGGGMPKFPNCTVIKNTGGPRGFSRGVTSTTAARKIMSTGTSEKIRKAGLNAKVGRSRRVAFKWHTQRYTCPDLIFPFHQIDRRWVFFLQSTLAYIQQ